MTAYRINPYKWFVSILCSILFILSVERGNAQQFYRSEGLELFNQGHFLSAITSMTDWVDQYSSERGIAYFYIAESHYNLGLAANQIENAHSNFKKSIHFFQLARKQVDLETIYIDKNREALYKIGWCQLRLAEISKSPNTYYIQAFQSFKRLAESENDSLQILHDLRALSRPPGNFPSVSISKHPRPRPVAR